jgi:ABC-type glycerol-3-phosphate transport system substrate-binding protein
MRIHRLALAGVLFAAGFASVAHADLLVEAPGVINNAGIKEATAAFTKSTGIKVTFAGGRMSDIMDAAKTGNPSPDVIILPMEPYNLMGNLSLQGGIKKDSFTPIARVQFGLATLADQPKPDISTVPKFIAVLKSAKQVLRSNPGNDPSPLRGSMVALLVDELLKKPEYAGVKSDPTAKEGDMAIQPISEIDRFKPALTLDAQVPDDLFLHMDMAAAVAARTSNEKDARAYIAFLRSPEVQGIWKSKGVDPF